MVPLLVKLNMNILLGILEINRWTQLTTVTTIKKTISIKKKHFARVKLMKILFLEINNLMFNYTHIHICCVFLSFII